MAIRRVEPAALCGGVFEALLFVAKTPTSTTEASKATARGSLENYKS